ncbi:flagellar basal-body rod protein FlgB [Aquabacterium commune]|uniref:Flagellar basal body rod protein FlgB n=1 Tax=Aquabacterium commune TaxID=70586 RepID=A0A4R6RBZ2_9BURK|nr:flagellar basal body rod protein FlgB [Aquabacterium commune]TDP83660.1 flagellar basal-body rod protein FlgB [Aquabacterium commune]
MLNQLTDSLNFHATALTLRSERQRLIASNIANADTPGYTARDFNFSDALSRATGRTSSAQTPLASGTRLAMATSRSGHLGLNGVSGQGAGAANPELNYASAAQTNLDNNTVDMDRERASFADNTLRYEATLRFINGQVRTLNTAMTGQ